MSGLFTRGLRLAAALPSTSRSLHMSARDSLPRIGRKSAMTLSEKQSFGVRPDSGTRGERGSDLDASAESRLGRQLPSLATLATQTDGLAFADTPICLLRCSKNNTKIAFTQADGVPICYTSSSQEGFKNAKKKTMVAGQATGVAAALRAVRRGVSTVRVVVKGLGPGRMAGVKGLVLGGLNVVSITDASILPELGPRPQKMRRI